MTYCENKLTFVSKLSVFGHSAVNKMVTKYSSMNTVRGQEAIRMVQNCAQWWALVLVILHLQAHMIVHPLVTPYIGNYKTLLKYIQPSECLTYPIKSKSEKINVFSISNPQAIMSLVFSKANWRASSNFISFQRNFSSSVNWITRGTSNTSCNHLNEVWIH